MKKLLSTAVCGAILATSAFADILRVEAGAGVWMNSSEGSISYNDSGSDTSAENDETSGYVWAFIKHPTPIVPNLRLEYAEVENNGIATGTFKNFNLGTATTTTSLEMKQYDIIPYYNILDNTAWITLDLGLDFKVVDLSYTADASGVFTGYSENENFVIPMLYARARVEIPATDIAIETDVKYVSYDSNTVYDVRAKVDYTLDITPGIQPALEIGYRMQKIETDESLDFKMNLEFSGVYAGLIVRF